MPERRIQHSPGETLISRRDLFRFVVLTGGGVFLASCLPTELSPGPTVRPSTLAPTRIPTQENKLEQIKTPFWNKTAPEQYKQEKFNFYDTTLRGEKPPFYQGSMPLSYRAAYLPGGEPGYTFRIGQPIFYSFVEFTNYFVYRGPLIVGSQTYDRQERLLAEVTNIIYFIDGNKQGMKIEEIHYGTNGRPMFTSRSQVNTDNGFKMKETEATGKKSRDYYFIWPVMP